MTAETITVSRRTVEQYVARLGEQEDALAAAARREAALEKRVLEYLHVIAEIDHCPECPASDERMAAVAEALEVAAQERRAA